MNITSPSFQEGEPIPEKYSCKGDNINPELRFIDVPSEAKSLALIVDDPDAPNGTFTHWVISYMSPHISEIHEHSVPAEAREGMNSGATVGYMGPCPPSGTHRYYFTVYALDTILQLSAATTKEMLEQAMEGHIIAKAYLVGTYSH